MYIGYQSVVVTVQGEPCWSTVTHVAPDTITISMRGGNSETMTRTELKRRTLRSDALLPFEGPADVYCETCGQWHRGYLNKVKGKYGRVQCGDHSVWGSLRSTLLSFPSDPSVMETPYRPTVLFGDSTTSDLIVRLEDRLFYCHSHVLGYHSSLFRGQREVILADVSVPAAALTLKYLYGRHIDTSALLRDVLLDVYKLAQQWGVTPLVKQCERRILTRF